MKKIGFMGAYDKANFITYTAKVLSLLGYKILVVDASSIQKIKYIFIYLKKQIFWRASVRRACTPR